MRLLILGGTQFVGRHLAELAIAGGHEVTLFNRGRTNPALFTEAERIVGDREHDLRLLGERHWDAAIDTSAYVPRFVRLAAAALRARADRYAFVSTISVYAAEGRESIDEESPLRALEDPTTEEVSGDTYGALKALCEEEARLAWGERALILRPGMIVGPHDPTDRMTYWIDRIHRGGRMAVPDRLEQPLQFIDARDLAVFILDMLEGSLGGTYNTIGPWPPLSFGRFLHGARDAIGAEAEFVPFPNRRLESAESLGKYGVPWLVPDDGSADAMFRASSVRAVERGLRQRPVEETYRDTLAWHLARPQPVEWRAGLSPVAEQKLLAETR